MIGGIVNLHKEDDVPAMVFSRHDGIDDNVWFICLRLSDGMPVKVMREDFTLKTSVGPKELLTILEINQNISDELRKRMISMVEQRAKRLNITI
tara:strand:- start:98 stop:379 length:282 start_codon:yes stop_codon:yes gene_type:complete